jgi:hypothetical protein
MKRRVIHHPNFVQLIKTLKPLLREYKSLRVMHFDDMCDWLAWYWNRGTMSWQINHAGEPQGVCLIKLFRYAEQFLDHDAHDPCNEFCFIEFLQASDPITMNQLCQALVDRWGPQKTVMWDRGARTEDGAPRIYRWDQFEKIVRRLTYGLTENV